MKRILAECVQLEFWGLEYQFVISQDNISNDWLEIGEVCLTRDFFDRLLNLFTNFDFIIHESTYLLPLHDRVRYSRSSTHLFLHGFCLDVWSFLQLSNESIWFWLYLSVWVLLKCYRTQGTLWLSFLRWLGNIQATIWPDDCFTCWNRFHLGTCKRHFVLHSLIGCDRILFLRHFI